MLKRVFQVSRSFVYFCSNGKSITERSCKVMHVNAASEGARQGREGRLERQSQANVIIMFQTNHVWHHAKYIPLLLVNAQLHF